MQRRGMDPGRVSRVLPAPSDFAPVRHIAAASQAGHETPYAESGVRAIISIRDAP